jgi:hypothetical protein
MDERVEAGAALLDERWQNWHNAIDLDTLNMGSERDCILGQLFGTYWKGKEVLNIMTGADYGFDAVYDGYEEFPVLTEAWRGAVARRVRADGEAAR